MRKELSDEEFRVVPAQGVSLEVCDERFSHQDLSRCCRARTGGKA
jgi:hypothetical protein